MINDIQDDLRTLVRQILTEEISTLRNQSGASADTSPKIQIREESVAIRNDAELMNFVRRVIDIAIDGRSVSEIKTGKWVFRLDNSMNSGATQSNNHHQDSSVKTITFDRGLVSERQIVSLSNGACIQAGKSVRFTPLAQDEIRRRQIQVQKV